MSYTGISTRESRFESLLTSAATRLEKSGNEQFAGLIRDAVNAKCGLHAHLESEVMQRGGVRIGTTYPCKLPAGHSGACNAE